MFKEASEVDYEETVATRKKWITWGMYGKKTNKKNIWNALMTSILLHDNLKNKDNCNKTLTILWWKKKKDANDTLNYPSPNKAKVVSQIK